MCLKNSGRPMTRCASGWALGQSEAFRPVPIEPVAQARVSAIGPRMKNEAAAPEDLQERIDQSSERGNGASLLSSGHLHAETLACATGSIGFGQRPELSL